MNVVGKTLCNFKKKYINVLIFNFVYLVSPGEGLSMNF